MHNIHPVILSGGSGTRLWPLSRKSFPKQFVPLFGQKSLFQQTVARFKNANDTLNFLPPLILTNDIYRFMTIEQLQEMKVQPSAILIEPTARNTAPAVLAAALHIYAQDASALMIISPADHIISDSDLFQKSIQDGVSAALQGEIITFGVRPTRPETGFGYLELSSDQGIEKKSVKLKSFIEKPDEYLAGEMYKKKNFLWNSGIFMFSASKMIEIYQEYAPKIYEAVSASLEKSTVDLDFVKIDKKIWNEIENISFDYAIMEKIPDVSVIPMASSWSDVGTWGALHELNDCDVLKMGSVLDIDCKKSVMVSTSKEMELVGIGIENMIVVSTDDAILVAPISRSQDVKLAVENLKSRGIKQGEYTSKDYRPWGNFETLALGERFQVKRIVVKPGAALSLQSHHHRSEHWIIVQGTAKVTVENKIKLLSENESIYVPLGAVHRLENPGKLDMILIEVQTGSYLGEDDIIRYQDIYDRLD